MAPFPDRYALSSILFVLRNGIPWYILPKEMGCGSGMTCWPRLHDWHKAKVWQRLHEILLAKLEAAQLIDWNLIDWNRPRVDSIFVRVKGTEKAKGAKKKGAKKGAQMPGLIAARLLGKQLLY